MHRASDTNAHAGIVSPLLLSHQLLAMADEAHRAGMPQSAARLLRLAHSVCNDRPLRRQ